MCPFIHTIFFDVRKHFEISVFEMSRLDCVYLQAGIGIKPNTPVDVIVPYVDMVDMVLIMTVEPGFGGQKFMGDMMSKVSKIKPWGKAKVECLRQMIT